MQLQHKQTNYNQSLLSTKQISLWLTDYILLILTLYPQLNIKCIKLIKTLLKLSQQNNKINKIISNFYLNEFNLIRNKSKQNQLQKVIVILTVIQTVQNIGNDNNYQDELVHSEQFKKDLYRLLLCNRVQSQIANSIAINIYGSLLKQLNYYNSQSQTFINLYSTIRCFGTHLVKDIFHLFYQFIQFQQQQQNLLINKYKQNQLIYRKDQLLDIIFHKLQHHQNSNVVKHCIQSILQSQKSYILFQTLPDTVYISLLRILNYGMHYLDCLFHMDSKMYSMISTFFSKYFNQYITKEQVMKRQQHIRLLLKAICDRVTFDHAIVALVNAFVHVQSNTKSITKTQLKYINYLIQKHYQKLPIRKRHQLMEGLTSLLLNHLSTKKEQLIRLTQKQELIDIKQLKQLQQNPIILNNNQISLSFLVKQCLLEFPYDCITMTYNNTSTQSMLYKIITKNYSYSDINNTLSNLSEMFLSLFQKIQYKNNTKQYFQSLLVCVKAIELLLFAVDREIQQQKHTNKSNDYDNNNKSKQIIHSDTVYNLQRVYLTIHQRFILDLSQCNYKNSNQRIFALRIQLQLFKFYDNQHFMLTKYHVYLKPQILVQQILNNISLLITDQIKHNFCIYQLDNQHFIDKQDISFIVSKCFKIIYSADGRNGQQNQDKLSRVGSQFLQWTIDNIQNKQCIQLIIKVLKARLEINKRQHNPINYTEQIIYQLTYHLSLIQLPSNRNMQNQSQVYKKLIKIQPIYKLRLFVLSSTILFNDSSQILRYLSSILTQLQDLADRYDFQNYSEIFYFIQKIFTFMLQTSIDQKDSTMKALSQQIYSTQKQHCNRISKLILSLMQSMLISLQYGIKAEDVQACISCAVEITFAFFLKNMYFQSQYVAMLEKIIQIGKQYWMFERVVTIKVIQKINQVLKLTNSKHKINLKKVKFLNLFPLLLKIICIQEYRGYDSAVQLYKILKYNHFYSQVKTKLHPNSDYQGTFCRLAFVSFISQKIKQISIKSNKNHIYTHSQLSISLFLQELFIRLLNQVKTQTKQKMFLTGLHKTRLTYWQCLLSFTPQWIIHSVNSVHTVLPSLQQIILNCIQMISQGNLYEIKFYLQLFLMKLLINSNAMKIVTPKIVQILTNKLIQCISHVNKNVSFIVISGLLINYLFTQFKIDKKMSFMALFINYSILYYHIHAHMSHIFVDQVNIFVYKKY